MSTPYPPKVRQPTGNTRLLDTPGTRWHNALLQPSRSKVARPAAIMRIRRRFLFVGVLLVVVLSTGAVLVSQLAQRERAEEVKDNSERLSHQIGVNLEMFFSEHANSLAFITALYRDGLIRSQEDFSYYARQTFSVLPGFLSLSATTPDYALIYQFPRVHPHDLKDYPDRYAFAEKARKTDRLTVTDPVRLVPQGQQGIGVYAPVFRGGQFKGLVIGTIDIGQLVHNQLEPIFHGIPFTISTRAGQVFYRSPGASEEEFTDSIQITARLADSEWIIRTPRSHLAPSTLVYDREILLVGPVLAAAVCLSLLYLFQANRLEIQQEALRMFETSYQDVSRRLETKLKENLDLCDQLRRAEGNLVKATRLAALGELSAVIAHEIRNPLSALINCIGTLKRGRALEGEDAELLDVSMKEAHRLNQIVTDILSFGRPKRLAPQRVRIAELLDEVIRSFAKDPHWNEKLTARRECNGHCPVIQADPDLLRQVFWNLMINAAQAMQDGGEILASCFLADGQEVEITIRDNGPGIPRDIQNQIFEPFFSTKGSGLGLGLSIVRNIVQDHGGEVSIQSEEGKGTSARVVLPLELKEENRVSIAGGG